MTTPKENNPQVQEALLSMLHNVALPVVIMDKEGTILYANCAMLALTGHYNEQVNGRNYFDLFVAPQMREEKRKHLSRIIESATETKIQDEQDIICNDKTLVPVSWCHTLTRDADGVVTGTASIGRDVTDQKQGEQIYHERELVLESILGNSRDGIVIIDRKGHVVAMNRSAEGLFDYTADEVIGHNVSMLMPSPYREDHDSYINNYLMTGKAKIIGKGREVPGRRKDGSTFPFRLTTSPEFRMRGNLYFVGIVSDLSHEKQVEDQLRRAQKMESIGTLAGGIAHDFNNILGGITGYTELMLEDAEPGSYLHEDLNEMLKACGRGKDLVLQILTFSRQDKAERETLYLQPIIKESLKLLRATIPTNIEVGMHIESNCPPVAADPTQIHQVLMNLGTNAYHAMRHLGGALTVSLSKVELNEYTQAMSPNLPYGSYLNLTVRDTGKGMDQETQDRIFDPFFTTKPLGEGTGMGLSVVIGIIKGHGGEIMVESELGQGSVVQIFLPALSDERLAHSDEDTATPGGREHIMLVDDDELLLKVQKRILARQGYRVSEFQESRDALAAFCQSPQTYALIITDQSMPHLTGIELAQKMLAIRPELPIILTTGFSDQASPEQAKEMGIREFLMKPVKKQEMTQSVRRLLDGD